MLQAGGVVHVQTERLVGVVAPAAQQDHAAVHEHGGMLVPTLRQGRGILIRGDHPVPLAVSVLPKPPGIVQGSLFLAPAPEDHDHPVGGALGAQAAGVVGAGRGPLGALDVVPGERVFLHVEDPNVVDGLLPGVAAEHHQVRPVVHDGVPVTLARGLALDRHEAPGGRFLSEIKEVQVIGGQVAAARGPRKNDQKIPVYGTGRVRGTWGGGLAQGFELAPSVLMDIVEEGFIGETVSSCIAGGLKSERKGRYAAEEDALGF